MPLTRDLRERLEAYATAHDLKVATAARMLLGESLAELDLSDEMARAERWQREQSLATWEASQRPDAKLLTLDDFKRAIRRPRTRRRPS